MVASYGGSARDYKSCRALNKEENTWLFDIWKLFI